MLLPNLLLYMALLDMLKGKEELLRDVLEDYSMLLHLSEDAYLP